MLMDDLNNIKEAFNMLMDDLNNGGPNKEFRTEACELVSDAFPFSHVPTETFTIKIHQLDPKDHNNGEIKDYAEQQISNALTDNQEYVSFIKVQRQAIVPRPSFPFPQVE
tara:strand:+ start:273 stop:602 length:330 start_codon:yes stop_codon:yes gene_type:complete